MEATRGMEDHELEAAVDATLAPVAKSDDGDCTFCTASGDIAYRGKVVCRPCVEAIAGACRYSRAWDGSVA